MSSHKLSFLFPAYGLKETALRFPLSILCSVILFIVTIGHIHHIFEDTDQLLKLALLCFSGYLWFCITQLAKERFDWHWVIQLGVGLTVFGAFGLLIFLSPQWELHLIYLLPALLLLVMVVAYVTSNDALSFWFFNRMTWYGAAVAGLATMIWGGGISVALASIHFLFDLNIEPEVYSDLWAFSSILLGPLYALSWVPQRFAFSEEDCHDPPGLEFLLNWILAPLISIYLLILYAYFIKILIAWELPRGQLAYMVTGFAGVGISTYLLGWPIKETGAPLLRFVYRFFFPALIIPVIMQFLAIGVRIEEYGVTEHRYFVAITALWFAIMAITFTMKVQSPPIKLIPGVLALLLVFGSFGPWGGVSLSGRSQLNRLEKLLTQYQILQDGKIVKTEQNIPFEDRQSISSILDYLDKTDRIDTLRPWFEQTGKTWTFPGSEMIVKDMGFEYVQSWQRAPDKDKFAYDSPRIGTILDVSNFDYVLGSQHVHLNTKDREWKTTWISDTTAMGLLTVPATISNQVLILEIEGKGKLTFDIGNYIARELQDGPLQDKANLMMEAKNGSLRGRLDFFSLYGEMMDSKPQINGLSFRILIKENS